MEPKTDPLLPVSATRKLTCTTEPKTDQPLLGCTTGHLPCAPEPKTNEPNKTDPSQPRSTGPFTCTVDFKTDLRPCFCISHLCNGKHVSRSTLWRHRQKDASIKEGSTISSVFSTDLDVPLYPGSKTTLREAVARKFLIFVANNGMSKKALSQTFQAEKQNVPDSKLPGTYEEALSLLKHEFIPLNKFDVCLNDCILFRLYCDGRDYSLLEKCPVCQEARFKPGTKRQPRKQFTCMPLRYRLQRWFGETSLAKLVHNGDITLNPETLTDFQDGAEYRSWFAEGGMFQQNRRGAVPLGLFTDGLNPNRNQLIQYSMWPILLTWFSLPPQYRTMLGPMMLYGIIPGNGRQEPKSLEPYMELIVDEILGLEECEMFNAYLKAPVSVKVRLVFFYCDIPAYSKLLHLSGQQALRACPYCDNEAEYCQELHKPVHTRNRRFLCETDELRSSAGFPQETERGVKPAPISYAKEKVWRQEYDNLHVKSHKVRHSKKTGMKGEYALMKSPDHDRTCQMSPDGMHTLADVISNLLEFISGKADTANVRRSEEAYGRFEETWLQNGGAARGNATRQSLPPAPWALNNKQKLEADQRVSKLHLPSYIELRHRPYFTKPWQLDRMHTKLQFATERVLSFCLRGMLGANQQETLLLFCDIIHKLMQTRQIPEEVKQLQQEVSRSVCLLERDFPISLMNITTHLLHHMPEDISRFGPLCGRWLFVLERTLCWISRQILNKKDPESTAMATYQIYDWACFQLLSGKVGADALSNVHDTECHGKQRLPTVSEMITKVLDPEEKNINSSPMQSSRNLGMLTNQQIDMLIERYQTVFSRPVARHAINPVIEKKTKLMRDLPDRKAPIKLGSLLLDESRNQLHCDSYVTVRKDGQVHGDVIQSVASIDFGRVKYYFDVNTEVCGKPYADQWAVVQVFLGGHLFVDGFLQVNTEPSLDMVVPVRCISEPYITAPDDACKLWFINFRLRNT